MAFAGELGLEITLATVLAESATRTDALLFSESNSRFLVEVAEKNRATFEEAVSDAPHAVIGRFDTSSRFVVRDRNAPPVIDEDIHALKEAWQKPLRW